MKGVGKFSFYFSPVEGSEEHLEQQMVVALLLTNLHDYCVYAFVCTLACYWL